MREYDFCRKCWKVTRISKETLRVMKILNLGIYDYEIRCPECKANEVYNLLYSNKGGDSDE